MLFFMRLIIVKIFTRFHVPPRILICVTISRNSPSHCTIVRHTASPAALPRCARHPLDVYARITPGHTPDTVPPRKGKETEPTYVLG